MSFQSNSYAVNFNISMNLFYFCALL